MTRARYEELMSNDDGKLTDEELADNWHFCGDFDGLLMQADEGLFNVETNTCICGYKFPKSPEQQQKDLT